MSKNITNKPLKGTSVSGNLGVFDTLQANNLVLSTDTIDGLMDGSQLVEVTIVDSTIQNTVIGANGPNEGHFTTITSTNDITFLSIDGHSVTWDATNGIFSIVGSLNLQGCVTLGNILVCENNIKALNTNGDLNLIPKGFGTIYLSGPVSNVVSTGNYLTSLANGNINMIASDYINFTSKSSSSTITTFSDQTYTTVNGDITLTTETGYGPKLITSIFPTGGNVAVATVQTSNVRVGDTVVLSNTNSTPILDGSYLVTKIINASAFTVSTGSLNITTNGTTGQLLKPTTNNINLNASKYIKIPQDINLTFGSTTNAVAGNTSGIVVRSAGDIVFSLPPSNIIQIPQSTNLQLGTSGSNFVSFDGNSLQVNTSHDITLTGTAGYINVDDIFMKDPNPMISNDLQFFGDTGDRGIQFNYWSGGTGGNSSLGWFGYKQSSGKFTLLTAATNTNEVMTGTPGKFDIGDISTTSITISQGGFIDMRCGNLLNVNQITGCGGTVNINSSDTVNITTGTRLALISGGDIFVPNNIPVKLGSTGSLVKEGTAGNIWVVGSKNIMLNTQTNGSVIIQPNVVMSFDGTSVGNQSISADTRGNLNLVTNNNINLNTTSGNIILAKNTTGSSAGFPSLQFGSNVNSSSSATETISGSTKGLFLYSNSSLGTINLIATSTINVSSSIGNIIVSSLAGDIQLQTTNGNTRLYQESYLVFGMSSTSNSIRSNPSGNLVLNGLGASVGNIIELKNTSIINLSANNSVNIPVAVQVNLDGGLGSRYIIADTNANILLTNANPSSGTIITSLNTLINNTGGSTILLNNLTNISTTTLTITGTNAFINATNVKLTDPILSLANYTLSSNDLKDRGLEFNYYSTTGSMKLGWFGFKNNSSQFTYYSDAVNNGEVISGTLGQFALGSVVVSNDIRFLNAGDLNMNCGTISNLNTILGCGGTVNIVTSQNMNISSSNIFLTANTSGKVLIPNIVPLAFGSTNNSISTDTNGNMMITANNGSGNLVLNANVQINGTTANVFSTITNIQDPIFSLGGVAGPVLDDLKDRGIEFKWYGSRNGTTGSKTGFFGFDNSSQRLVYIPDASNVNEIITGPVGDVEFAKGYFSNLDVQCGTVANVAVLTACSGQGLSIVGSTLNISSSNINIPTNSLLSFGSSSNSISATSSGNLNITSVQNTMITSILAGIILNTNTAGSGFTQLSTNSRMYFGSQTSGNFLFRDTSGNFNITNTTGDIYISPYTNNSTTSYGNVILPGNDSLVFANTTTRVSGDGSSLKLYGSTLDVTAPLTTFKGDVNVSGNLTWNDVGKYIYPLGTKQQLGITSIVNSSTAGNVLVTTSTVNYLVVGDTVTLMNTDSTPTSNGTYTVNRIVSNTTFSIPRSTLSLPGTTGTVYGVLKLYQGKDVGIEVDYWSTVGNTSVTAGSANYKQAFFGWVNNTQQWTYYSNATIQNDVVTQGVLGDIRANELYAAKISGFTLDGPIVGGNFTVAGSNFQISGGAVDNTPIGQTSAQSGRFTALNSTVSTSLENVTMQSNLNYSIERFTLSSLLPTRNPSTSTIVTYLSVNGATFTATGTMGSTGISDGQVKKLICSSMGTGCEYRLAFASGKLIAPNPLGGSPPTRMTFRRQGQSCELTWDASLSAWCISGGNGVYLL